jgi:predicted enzyme related to lactoylglutathione lyase
MTDDRYIPGVPCWVDTNQPDPQAAAEFYRGLFGWELEDQMPPESGAHYFAARIRGHDVAAVSSVPEGAPPIATWNTYVWVQRADATAEKVREAGGAVLSEPFDVFDAGRMAVCSDPEGAVFCLWQPNRHRGATLVNAPGTVNFNDLHTRDLERAKAFYSAVFGWTTLEMDGGFTAWSLPGYGDFLEAINPGTRERNAALGAPDGFADVVASLSVLGAEQPDTPAHWGVTFAVEAADATAERAAGLGGTVLAGPFDAPWVRMAVIADPQGATFVASQFVPEQGDAATAT